MQPNQETLSSFIVRAKAASYVGDGAPSLSYRPQSHDLQFHEGPFAYLDSYFGGQDFLGQEVVYYEGRAIWAMNYYGYILRPDLIDVAQAGRVIKASLSALYTEGRFLGDFSHRVEAYVYSDHNEGDAAHFTGREEIRQGETVVYELLYHGGLIR